MNSNDRVTIATHYHIYCQNRANGDPVGGFEDIRELFRDLAASDPKLKELFDETEAEVFED